MGSRLYVIRYSIILANKIDEREEVYSYQDRDEFIKRYKELAGKWYIMDLWAAYAELTPIDHHLIMNEPF